MHYNFDTNKIVNRLAKVKWFAVSPYQIAQVKGISCIMEAVLKQDTRVLLLNLMPAVAFKLSIWGMKDAVVKWNDDGDSGRIIYGNLTMWFKLEYVLFNDAQEEPDEIMVLTTVKFM